MVSNHEYKGRPRSLKMVIDMSSTPALTGPMLREFLDEFYNETDDLKRQQMLADEPPLVDIETTNAYLAAVAEHLSFENKFTVPEWALGQHRFLKRPYFPSGLESLKAICIVESPTAFRRRMIFVDMNPLSRPRKTNKP